MGWMDKIMSVVRPPPPRVEAQKGLAEKVGEAAKKVAVAESEFRKSEEAKPLDAAKQNYEKNGDVVFDLNSPGAREGLVVQSPQIDSIDSTTHDRTRCGAACVVDALVLDGNHQASAAALTKLGKTAGYQPTSEQATALAALKSGKLTPKQAAHLQEFVHAAAEKLPVRSVMTPDGRMIAEQNVGPAGMTPNGMASVLAHLKAGGAFKSSANVSFIASERQNAEGKSYNHWTVVSRDKTLFPTSVDPWPNTMGQKTLKHHEPGAMPSWLEKEGVPNKQFLAEVNLSNGSNRAKALVDVRTMPIRDDEGVLRQRKGFASVKFEAEEGKPVPGPESWDRQFRDKDTHEPLAPL